MLRNAGLGARRSRRLAHERAREPRRADAVRRARCQGARDQSDVFDDDAPRVPRIARRRRSRARAAARRSRDGSERVLVVDPHRVALLDRIQVEPRRSRRVPRAVSLARAGEGLQSARPVEEDPGRRAHARQRVLRSRRHPCDDGRRLRAFTARRQARVRRHAGGARARCGRPIARSRRCSSSNTRASRRCTR